MQGDLFTHLSFGETLGRIFNVYVDGLPVFTIIALVVTLPHTILKVITLAIFSSATKDVDFDHINVLHFPKSMWILLLMQFIVGIVFTTIGTGAVTRAVGDIYAGRRPQWQHSLVFAVQRLPSLLIASLLMILGVTLGFVCLFLPGLFLLTSWLLYTPAIVLEGCSAIKSLARSWNLAANHWCYIFCTVFVMGLIIIFVTTIFSILLLGGTGAGKTMFSFSGVILGSIPSILLMPLGNIVAPVLYVSLRVHKEGLDAGELGSELGEAPTEGDYRAVSLMESSFGGGV